MEEVEEKADIIFKDLSTGLLGISDKDMIENHDIRLKKLHYIETQWDHLISTINKLFAVDLNDIQEQELRKNINLIIIDFKQQLINFEEELTHPKI